MNVEKYIAHRGFAIQYPENTLYACRAVAAAKKANVLGIEIDIQLTKDGKIVVWHDNTIKRLVGVDECVQNLTLSELLAATKSSPHFKGDGIATLEQVLEAVNHSTGLYIEIKKYDYDVEHLCREFASRLKSYGNRSKIVIHSFSRDVLNRIRPLTENIGVQYGYLFGKIEEFQSAEPGFVKTMDYLHPNHKSLVAFESMIADAGKPLNVWTPNTTEDLERVLELKIANNVEGIITDQEEFTLRKPAKKTAAQHS